MKIFVTGATGFIGKHLVRKLLNEGNAVTVVLREGKISPFEKNVGVHYLDALSVQKEIEWMEEENFDGIIHLASLYLTMHKPEDVNPLIDSNVRLGSLILECAAQAKIPWFINTGTFWQHYQNKDYSPVNLYAATKQAFETIAQYYIETEQIKFVSLHLSDTYGPNDTRPKIFNLWKKISKSGENMKMSPGEQLIDISHVDDVVSAFVKLAQCLHEETAEIMNGDVFAVRAEKQYTLKELAGIFENATDTKLNITWGGSSYREREVMVPWNRGKKVRGWDVSVDMEEGIKQMFRY